MTEHTLLIIDNDDASGDKESFIAECHRRGIITTTAVPPDGLRALYRHKPDAVLLDATPKNGLQILERIRDLTNTPVIVKVADVEQTVKALESGADDAVIMPFESREIIARLASVIRRSHHTETVDEYVDGYVQINFLSRVVISAGQERDLTPIEFRLLEVFVNNVNIVLTPDQLLDMVWRDPLGVNEGVVPTAVCRLKYKLGWRDINPSPIQSVRGVGYRYKACSKN